MEDFNELLKNPAFKDLDSQMIENVKKAYSEIQGKSSVEQVGIVMRYCQNFSGNNKISKAERDLMVEVIINNMPEGEREKMRKLSNMIR